MTNEIKNTNYFKKVKDFSKNVFVSELDNSGATYNILDFLINNIIVLILLIIIFLIIYLGITYFKKEINLKAQNTIKTSFQHPKIDNEQEKTIPSNDMESPKQPNKYTYSFNLIINDFYCNKGKWKCLMLKGQDMSNIILQDCYNFNNDVDIEFNKNITAIQCFKFDELCKTEKENYIKNNSGKNNFKIDNFKKIEDPKNMNERVDVICNAIKNDENKTGKELLSCGMTKCSFMGKNMLKGMANALIEDHREYCEKVYTTKKKVENNTDKRYADEVDNVCSNKNLFKKYPHLIPRNINKYFNVKENLDKDSINKFDDETTNNLTTKDNCWDSLIDKLPIQSPGVWLHPFINNIRIVLTTYTTDNFDDSQFNFSHSHDSSFTKRKYRIKKIFKKHASVQNYNKAPSCSGIADLDNLKNENVYREYFDIDNIPIKELFNFSIVINEKSCEVYIEGKLAKTQVLFGNPRYNKGDLYLNSKGGLNGSIIDFKYFPYSINKSNIANLINQKTMIQEIDNSGIHLEKEHQHNLDIVHTHEYENSIEDEHKHLLDKEDINVEYHLD